MGSVLHPIHPSLPALLQLQAIPAAASQPSTRRAHPYAVRATGHPAVHARGCGQDLLGPAGRLAADGDGEEGDGRGGAGGRNAGDQWGGVGLPRGWAGAACPVQFRSRVDGG